jgi:hypothetical protein
MHRHDAAVAHGSVDRGKLGDRPSVRQLRDFRRYESGNAMKAILQWSTDQTVGAMDAVSDAQSTPPSRPVRQPPSAPAPPAAVPASARRLASGGVISRSQDALWVAVGDRDVQEVARLLSQGVDPNMVCPDQWVRPEHAPRDGSTGRSLLHHAAWAGCLDVFRLIVQHGGDVHKRRDTAWRPNGCVHGRGSTPFHHACMYNRVEIVRYLLDELKVDVNQPGEQGFTPLHIATKFGYPRLAEELLARGARVDLLTREEKTARDLTTARNERSHTQHQCGMLELFDRYDTEAHVRPRLPAGALLPPHPRGPQMRQPHLSRVK